jgi:hypothetical protein
MYSLANPPIKQVFIAFLFVPNEIPRANNDETGRSKDANEQSASSMQGPLDVFTYFVGQPGKSPAPS